MNFMHDIYHTIIRNRKIDHIVLPLQAIYCVWLIITLILNFKWFAYSIDAQFVLISLYYMISWISSMIKKHRAERKE
ncbi:hypothetical protein FC57_GL000876 [Lactobacillus ultunensis DSM 16047]|nr:hypothetical protein FC57_GL000876 [Lactobacillus ultunensis DSM 16047]